MGTKALLLTDLIAADDLQELQDAFAAATKLTAVIVKPDGHRITVPSNGFGLCKAFQAHKETRDICRRFTIKVALEAGVAGHSQVYHCPHIGLTSAAVPIIVEGVYVGCWIFAQIRLQNVSPEQLAAAAKKAGSSQAEMEARLERLPRFSVQEFEQFFCLVEVLTKSITQLGHNNLKLTERDRELRGLTEQMSLRDSILTRLNQTSQEALYICDFYTGEMLMVNKAFCKQAGLAMEDILGRKCWDIRGYQGDSFCDDCPRGQLLGQSADEEKKTAVVEYYNSNYKRWLRCKHEAIPWYCGCAAHMVTQQDVTAEHEMRARLEQMAYYDSVTGLPNQNRLSEDMKSSKKRAGGRRAICLFLSSLKTITDIYGSVAEEQIIRTVVAWWQSLNLKECDIYCLNEDEYFMVFREDSEEKVLSIARHIKERFSRPWAVDIGKNGFSFVGGLGMIVLSHYVYLSSQQEAMKIIARMFDEARKRDGLLVYDEKIDQSIESINRLRIALEASVKQKMQGFSVAYQPIMDLASGTWKGVEALCRWTGPGGGTVSPSVFIPEAERAGLIMTIGMWVLETSIQTVKKIGLDRIPGFYLSVNMSPRQMMDGNYAARVKQLLDKYGYEGKKLNIEITESSEMVFSDFTISVIESLREQGVTLALDDFGTGYSSFNNLKKLPAHYLKTEREFIEGIEKDSYLQFYIFVLAEIAHAHGMKLIVEGIETEEQLKIARNNGADHIQGYFFSRPLTPEDLEKNRERFVVKDTSYILQSAETIDIKRWLNGKSAYEVNPILFKLLHQCMRIVLSDQDLATSVESILGLAGRQFGASRTFVFLHQGAGLRGNTYEWCAEGVVSHKPLLEALDTREFAPGLVEAFKDKGIISASDVSKLPEGIYDRVRRFEIESLALTPIWKDEELQGFVGFSSETMLEWSADAIVMLWNLETIIASLVSRNELKKDVFEKQAMLNAVFMNQSLYSYVSDPDSYDILWMNDKLAQSLHLGEKAVGCKCYKVVGGYDAPCPKCLLAELKKKPNYSQIESTITNRPLDKQLVCYDCLFPWAGGRRVHMCYALGIVGKDLPEGAPPVSA